MKNKLHVKILKSYFINENIRRKMVNFKGRMQCFSMQVLMNKCFLVEPDKNWRRSVLWFSRKTHTLISKMTSPSWRLG